MKKIIIIGAGLGGLTAANILVQKGHAVTLFESHSAPGGYTAGFWRKGFYFESGTLAFEESGLVFSTMKKIGALEKINFVRHEPFRFLSDEMDGVPETYRDYKKLYYENFPAEKHQLDRFFSALDPLYAAFASLGRPGLLSKAAGVFRLLLLKLKYGDMTVREFTEKFFPGDTVLFRSFNDLGYPDMPAMILGGALHTLFVDYWTVQEGMQSWADVLAEKFTQSGGELKLKHHVDRILVKDGQAYGVRCGGTEYAADYVIAACDYKKTFLTLLDRDVVPGELRQKVEAAAVSEGFFHVYLGLDIPREKLRYYMKSSHVSVLNTHQSSDIYDTEDEDYFNKCSFGLYAPSLLHAENAPEGKSSVMLYSMIPCRWQNNWGGGDTDTYRRLKEKAAQSLIERAHKVIPALSDRIDFCDAATPLTFERYTHNTDGATSAWSWNPNKRFYKNMLGTHVKTPVKNLYIASCWAMQIGGIPGALFAARKAASMVR
ncbi:MAG: phytoene desaturase family protein [Spirochaetota bacterium]